jgi:hypothetical protein
MDENNEDLERSFECFVVEDDDGCPEEAFKVLEVSDLEKFYLPTRFWKMMTERALSVIFVILWLKVLTKKRLFVAAYNVAKSFTSIALCFIILEKL